ncbi:hypothetical protein Lalb_Chr15g0076371 [Lupinus albus]|uniref:Uncharacterized protein n=1 Tax=Lupinus albus TaxID=3870 RepID=A0A6A4NWS5_LUPAL|nr:hypothetical protein Lalb_Chr15g0076371 [Lupinus albus]
MIVVTILLVIALGLNNESNGVEARNVVSLHCDKDTDCHCSGNVCDTKNHVCVCAEPSCFCLPPLLKIMN